MPWKEKDEMNLREEFVLKALGNVAPFSELCKEYGISRKTGYKWMSRFRDAGLPGLRNQSRKPSSHPDALSEAIVCELIKIKRTVRPQWGPKKVLALYERMYGTDEAPSLSSVKRVMERAGYVQRRRRHRSGIPDRPKEEVVAVEPNDQWTVDFKGWWKTRDRKRCEPLTVRDGASRFVLDIRAMETTRGEHVRTVFERLFEQYGLPGSIRSDNGSPFAASNSPLGLSRLSCWWVSLGIRLDRIDPGRPDQNGAHERIHKDIRAELQLNPAKDIVLSQKLFDQWRNEFNWQRPNEAIGMKFPGEVYIPSQTPYVAGSLDISYPPSWLERRVTTGGTIRVANHRINISIALEDHVVGLQPVDDRLDVWFDYLRLGQIDLNTFTFTPVMKNKKRCRPSSGGHAPQRRALQP